MKDGNNNASYRVVAAIVVIIILIGVAWWYQTKQPAEPVQELNVESVTP